VSNERTLEAAHCLNGPFFFSLALSRCWSRLPYTVSLHSSSSNTTRTQSQRDAQVITRTDLAQALSTLLSIDKNDSNLCIELFTRPLDYCQPVSVLWVCLSSWKSSSISRRRLFLSKQNVEHQKDPLNAHRSSRRGRRGQPLSSPANGREERSHFLIR
jgi:hypothetical protein